MRDFAAHKTGCDQCRQFDPKRTATLALLCLEGSVMWKKENVTKQPRDRAPHDPNRTSKAEAKRLMQYK